MTDRPQDRLPQRDGLAAPEPPAPSSWIGEIVHTIAQTVGGCLDSTPRTVRLCAVIAVAAASLSLLAYFR